MKTHWKLISICLALVGALIAIVTWFQGVGWWTLALAALMLVCPIVVVWVAFGGLTPKDALGRRDRP